MKQKRKFLELVAGRPFSDILTFPIYFHYSIATTIGPRFTFLRERNSSALKTASLDSLMRSNDEDFARKIAKVDAADYVVYQAQWTRMYGSKFDFIGRPKRKSEE